jgi:hypothetical protein
MNDLLRRAANIGGQQATFKRWLDDDVQAHVPPQVMWKGEITQVPTAVELRRIVKECA